LLGELQKKVAPSIKATIGIAHFLCDGIPGFEEVDIYAIKHAKNHVFFTPF
jgi:hypothetical protein